MGTSPTPAVPTVEIIEKSYSYFDGTTLESRTEPVKVEFTAPITLTDAMTRIDNSQEVVLRALTSYLRRAALSEAKKSVLSKGVSKKIVLGVLRPFRALPPWSTMDRAKQTEALLTMLRSNPAILEAIKAANAASDVDDDDNDGDDE